MTTRVVGDVAVRVGADVGPLKIGLQDGSRAVNRFDRNTRNRAATLARNLRNVGIAAVAMGAAMSAAGRQAISALDGVGKKAAQIGTTAEELQRFAFAARSAGVDSTKLESSLERFVKRLGEAEQGFGAAKRALEAMGLSAEELAKMPLSEAVALVADELGEMGSASEQAANAAALFGREGVAMINMLRDGGDALRDTMNAADAFGAVVSNETVAAAEALEDRMGRLSDGIKGQLNEALVEMGPLLVSAAEFALRLARGFNGLVTVIADTYNAIEAFLDPVSSLEQAHDEVTAAMADEIRQSQLLDAALERGGRMSVEAARTKLSEAQARRENALAAIEEQRAISLGSDAYGSLTSKIQGYNDALNAMVPPGADDGLVPMDMQERVEDLQAGLATALRARDALLQSDEALEEQAARTTENIERLQEAIANATGGVVTVGGATIEPIEPGEDKDDDKGGGGGGPVEAREGSFLDQLLGLDPESQDATAERMESALEKQREFLARANEALQEAREQGLITQEEYNRLEQDLQHKHNAKMRDLRMAQAAEALGATAQMFEGMAQLAGEGGEKVLRISKAFAAAEALVSTLRGAAKELEKGIFGFKTAAMVIARGSAFIAAIKGASPGAPSSGVVASGGLGGAAQDAGSIPASQDGPSGPRVSLTLIGDQGFSRAQIVQIAEALNDSSDDGQLVQLRGRR